MSSTEPWRNPRPATNLDEVRHRVPLSSTFSSWLRAWWPALLWAAIISLLSTDSFSSARTSFIFEPLFRWLYPSISEAGLELAHHLLRKSAHITEYFIFFLLLYHGIRVTRQNSRPWHWSWALIAWFIAAVYSALDEIHQIFVPSRGPSPWDSLLDSTGAFVALLALFLIYRLRRRLPSA
jgi:VanZ family protein